MAQFGCFALAIIWNVAGNSTPERDALQMKSDLQRPLDTVWVCT